MYLYWIYMKVRASAPITAQKCSNSFSRTAVINFYMGFMVPPIHTCAIIYTDTHTFTITLPGCCT